MVSQKHNTKHDRSPSKYPERLAARGLSKTPRMKDLAQLCHEHDHKSHGSPHYGRNAS